MMSRRTTEFPGLDLVSATLADLRALEEYDPAHADGSPWRYRHVIAVKQVKTLANVQARGIGWDRRLYQAQVEEVKPWFAGRPVCYRAGASDPVAAALLAVRYLRWRWGDEWKPPAPGKARCPFLEAFNDELDESRPASWVGRLWVNGRPAFVFQRSETEAGFPCEAAAVRAAADLVRDRLPHDWRTWLCRSPRPWVGPAPAGLLDQRRKVA